VTWLSASDGNAASCQYAVVRIDEARFGCSRDAVHRGLQQFNIFARKYFYPLCSQYDCYRHLPSADATNLPNAVRAAQEVLCVPLYGELTEADVDRICDVIAFVRDGAARNVAAGTVE
jgi:dTDP-4-amino-4,6-dideoxygalactose transaminase